MADKGNLYLKNSAVISLYDSTKAYEATVQETLYSQYKTAFKISKSNYFRGDAADSFKNYITNGTINIISGMMDISSDMSMIIQLFAEAFYQYEYNHDGRVEEGALDYINQTLNSKENTFEDAKGELNAVLQLAAKYISTKGLSMGTVNTGYTETRNAVKKIREDLYAVDGEALKSANELLERIYELRTLIERMMAFCYNDDGKINADNLNKIQTQDWFQQAGNITLYLMLEEDPFEYTAGEVTLSEDQWAAGLCSDIYAYAGYSFLTASGEAGVEDGTAFAKGKAAVLNANGYAQFTDYLRGQANVNVLYAEGEAKADATAQIFGDDGKLDVQLGASAKAEAIAAEAEASAGINILGGEVGVEGGVNVGIGAHADVGYRDGIFKVDIGASLGIGASGSIDVDVGGMVDTISDTATAAWDGIKDGWNKFTSWF